jgi:sigma-B regulation protein RsbU (phosphoserine phosphatase)
MDQFIMSTVQSPPRALIADDQPDVLEALRLLLKAEGYQIEAVNSPPAVLESLHAREWDLLLLDLNYARDTTSGREGLDLLAEVRKFDQLLPVVLMTAWGSVELAVEAMQMGGSDFVLKPWENKRLLSTLRAQVEKGQIARKSRTVAELELLRQSREFEETREIQSALLPSTIPQIPGYEIAAEWQAARSVTGDYFDVLPLAGGKLAICIADVAGKGIPAAMVMSNLQAAIRASAGDALPPDELCARLNRLMCDNLAPGKFITLFYCILDPQDGSLTYTNAGHNAPMLVSRGGDCIRLAEGGALLGALPAWKYESGHVRLRSGDRLLLFTDGLIEARSADDEEFGEKRLVDLLSDSRDLGAAQIKGIIQKAAAEFQAGPQAAENYPPKGGTPSLQDDLTFIVVASLS